jgi:hypothetical protein
MGAHCDPIRIRSMFRRLCAGLLVAFLAPAASAQDAMSFQLVAAKNCRAPCHIEIAADGMISSESAVVAFRAVATTSYQNRSSCALTRRAAIL